MEEMWGLLESEISKEEKLESGSKESKSESGSSERLDLLNLLLLCLAATSNLWKRVSEIRLVELRELSSANRNFLHAV